jgi:hypothetical protein
MPGSAPSSCGGASVAFLAFILLRNQNSRPARAATTTIGMATLTPITVPFDTPLWEEEAAADGADVAVDVELGVVVVVFKT